MTKRGPNDLEQQIEDLNAVKVTLYAEVKKYRDELEDKFRKWASQ